MESQIILLLIVVFGAIAGYYQKSLTISGCIAACFVGILTTLGLHAEGLILLGAFFVTSSSWSKYKRYYKNKVEERHEKGPRRDWQQVVANGGVASIMSFFYYIDPDPVWIFAFCILLASSNSDTWASEIGTLSTKPPISVRTFRVVLKGTSGAVSTLGTLAAICGSFLIAVLSFYLFELKISVALFIFILGFLGNVIDTILGASVQAVYNCKICRIETEKVAHCGHKTKLVRGYTFFNNDIVNFLSSLIAALIGMFFYQFLNIMA